MNRNYFKQPDGYRETIERGIAGVQTFRGGLTEGTLPREKALARLKTEIETADAIVIGAGAGLSTSAGFIYRQRGALPQLLFRLRRTFWHTGYVFRRILPVSGCGDQMGFLGKKYLRKSLHGSTEIRLSGPVFSGKG